MADIVPNATGTLQNNITVVASPQNDTSLTIAAGSDRYLLAVVVVRDTAMPGIAMTWNGVAVTLLNSQKQDTWDEWVYIFGLSAPDTGNQTAVLSWTGGGTFRYASRLLCLNNVSGVSGTLINNSGASADPTQNIATAPGDATLTAWTHSGTTTAGSWPGAGYTSLMQDAGHGSIKYTLSTSSNDAHQFAYDEASANWGVAGIRLLKTGGGGGGSPSPVIVGKQFRGLIYS